MSHALHLYLSFHIVISSPFRASLHPVRTMHFGHRYVEDALLDSIEHCGMSS